MSFVQRHERDRMQASLGTSLKRNSTELVEHVGDDDGKGRFHTVGNLKDIDNPFT